ncbi:hypothetical protein BSLA_01r4995 [Burkholderia stabilis]|nr:hypothetical protein BSLA_01r4995 [Burkholderia stabilis]
MDTRERTQGASDKREGGVAARRIDAGMGSLMGCRWAAGPAG